ncbi:SGNH/GDSL hydrolase family protein [Effusibacillus pohliae]|uniref:SGNH/GDSL hydrolase family protein n=1 Tax=Effusibacillus pohliae TaxID=232270 RepID=UPI000381A8C8|nr:SGNH/GDSL hydrolase family protein [Effusibacillus pohliae]
MARNVYLALGDSITFGHEATERDRTFVSQISSTVRRLSLAERTLVVARNGWTASDLLQAVRFWIPPAVWETTNVLTLLVGGNDLRRRYYSICLGSQREAVIRRSLNEFSMYMDHLCRSIKSQRIPYVLVPTVYNPVPNSPIAVEAVEQLNRVIHKCAAKYHFTLVDIYAAFKGKEHLYINRYRNGRLEDLMLPFRRPIHPNDEGHRKIAELVEFHLCKQLRDGKRTKRC